MLDWSLKFSDVVLELDWQKQTHQLRQRSLRLGTLGVAVLLFFSILRDIWLQWDGWEQLMLIRLFVIAPVTLSPWLVCRTTWGRRNQQDVILVALCGLSLALCMMVVGTPTIPGPEKPIVSVLFIPIMAVGSLLFSLSFPKRLIYVTASVLAFALTYIVIDTSPMRTAIMIWTSGSIGGTILLAAYHLEKKDRLAWWSEQQLVTARAARESLLSNVFPEPVVERLLRGEAPIADRYDFLVVIFVDVVGFTTMARSMDPSALVALLDRLFSDFDAVVREFGFTKVKTIGDAYMTVGGLPWEGKDNRALAGAGLAWTLVERARDAHGLAVRAGIHCGPAVAGVVGKERFLYDFWGDTVNVASRLESTSSEGKVQLSEELVAALDGRAAVVERGLQSLKGLGERKTFWLEALPDAAG